MVHDFAMTQWSLVMIEFFTSQSNSVKGYEGVSWMHESCSELLTGTRSTTVRSKPIKAPSSPEKSVLQRENFKVRSLNWPKVAHLTVLLYSVFHNRPYYLTFKSNPEKWPHLTIQFSFVCFAWVTSKVLLTKGIQQYTWYISCLEWYFSANNWTMWPSLRKMGKLWEVIGGAEKGGIVVRQGAKCWAGRFETGCLLLLLHRMAVSQKILIEFHANCYGIRNWYCGCYHLRCLTKRMYVFFFKIVPILHVVLVQRCLWRSQAYVLRIVGGMFTKLCSTYMSLQYYVFLCGRSKRSKKASSVPSL